MCFIVQALGTLGLFALIACQGGSDRACASPRTALRTSLEAAIRRDLAMQERCEHFRTTRLVRNLLLCS